MKLFLIIKIRMSCLANWLYRSVEHQQNRMEILWIVYMTNHNFCAIMNKHILFITILNLRIAMH